MAKIALAFMSSYGNSYNIQTNIGDEWFQYWHRPESPHPLYQLLANEIINQPYADFPKDLLKHGKTIIYRLNHDVSHSIRQMVNSTFFLEMLKTIGVEPFLSSAISLTVEEVEIIKLAAFLFRAGRTNEEKGSEDPSNQERSARIFNAIAEVLGFAPLLVESITYCVHYTYLELTAELIDKYCQGFQGEKSEQEIKLKLIKTLLHLSHHTDLVRCFSTIDWISEPNKNNLATVLLPEYVETTSAIVLNFARTAAEVTGTPYYMHNEKAGKRHPNLLFKKQALTNVAATIEKLNQLSEVFTKIVAEQNIRLSEQLLKEAQQTRISPLKQIDAANTIKRAFTIRRAHLNTKQVVGVAPPSISLVNLTRLQEELKKGEGLCRDEKARKEKALLLEEEQELFQYLLEEFPWTLKHLTPYYHLIEQDGNKLKSLHQRKREGHNYSIRHTHDFEARADNIFFRIGSPRAGAADFLQDIECHEIRVPLRAYLNKNYVVTDQLAGLWLSSTWSSFYTTRQLRGEFGTTKRQVRYVKECTSSLINSKDHKIYEYYRANGEHFTRTVSFNDETVTGAELLQFLSLNIILELRLIGGTIRENCLHKRQDTLEAVVDLLYESVNFEGFIPQALNLNDERIEVLPYRPYDFAMPEEINRVVNALETGLVKRLNDLLDEGLSCNMDIGCGMTPLSYVLLNGLERYKDVAHVLITRGATTGGLYQRHSTILDKAVNNRQHETVELILTTGVIEKCYPKIKRFFDLNQNLSAIYIAIARQDTPMLKVFIKYGLDFSRVSHWILLALTEMPELSALDMLLYLKSVGFNFKSTNWADDGYLYTTLKNFIQTDKQQLLEVLLVLTEKPNVKLNSDSQSLLNYAKELNQRNAFDLLVNFGAEDEPSIQTETIYHLIIQDKVGNLLIAKRRHTAFWQSIYFSGVPTAENIRKTIFLALGINLNPAEIATFEKIKLDGPQQIAVITVENKKGYPPLQTENWSDGQWVSPLQCLIMPMDPLTSAYGAHKSNEAMQALIDNLTLLEKAITASDENEVRRLLQEGVYDPFNNGLYLACDNASPNLAIIKALLAYGYDVNTVFTLDEEKYTPITFSIIHHRLDVLSLLIANNAAVNQSLDDGVTPLMLAAELNQFDTFNLLERHGALLSHPSNRAILAYVCFKQCSEKMFDYLLERTNVEEVFAGLTPLLHVSMQQNKFRAEKLLKKGANSLARDPKSGKTASSFFSSRELDIFAQYKTEKFSILKWSELKTNIATYLTITQKINHPCLQELILEEYELDLLDNHDDEDLNQFARKLLQDAGESSFPVRIALTHRSDVPVTTCIGMDVPVIAIHKEFLLHPKTSYQQLCFALAHEIEFINVSTNLFNIPSVKERVEFDKNAAKNNSKGESALSYLQFAASFFSNHYSEDNFSWPNICYKTVGYSDNYYHFEERIKVFRLQLAQDHDKQIGDVPIFLSEKLKEKIRLLNPKEYYPDFPKEGSSIEQQVYLIRQLDSLQDELLPYEFCKIPSCRLKAFVRLMHSISHNTDFIDRLLIVAHDLKLPCFEYLYLSTNTIPQDIFSGMFKMPPQGYFKKMHQAVTEFIEARHVGEAKAAAKKIIELYPLLQEHGNLASLLDSKMTEYVCEHGELPIMRYFESNINSYVEWPNINDNDGIMQTHLKWAINENDNLLWKVLWILGVVFEPCLYKLMPEQALMNLLRYKSDVPVNDIPNPLVNLDPRSLYPYTIHPLIGKYFSEKPCDKHMLKGHFVNECEQFICANYSQLIAWDDSDIQDREAVRVLLSQMRLLMQGEPIARQFVRDFFLKDSYEIFLNRFLASASLYVQFLIEQAYFWEPYELAYFFKKRIHNLFKIPLETWFKVLQFGNLEAPYLSNLFALVSYILGPPLNHSLLAFSILEKYLNAQGYLDIFSEKTYAVLDFLNEKIYMNPFDGSLLQLHWQPVSQCQLGVSKSINLYRMLDKHLAFRSGLDASQLSEFILLKIKLIQNPKERLELLYSLLFIKNTASRVPINDRELFREAAALLTSSIVELYGEDDGSRLYYLKLKRVTDLIYARATLHDALYLLEQLANAICAQYYVSQYMGCLLEPEQHGNYIQKKMDFYVILAQGFSFLGENKKDKLTTLEFISSPLTNRSLSTFVDYIASHPKRRHFLNCLGYYESINVENKLALLLTGFYHRFWDLKLTDRAIVLDSLMISIEEEANENSHYKAYLLGFKFTCNKLFPDAHFNEREAFAQALLTAYLSEAYKHERQFLLAGMLVTTNEAKGARISVGRKLALLCEHLGPAYVKLAQAIHSHPNTPDDIKEDLAHVKGRANPPYRWVLWRLIKNNLTSAQFDAIGHLGKLLGSASYNLAVQEKTASGEEQVLLLLRENAAYDAEKGFAHLQRTISACDHPLIEHSRASFLSMIEEAERGARAELDYIVGDEQHALAAQLYNGYRSFIVINKTLYHITFEACKSLESGVGFRRLSLMHGVEFNDLAPETYKDIRKAIALAIIKKEFSLILSGGQFDCDRHGNQLRVYIQGNHLHLGLYDFGEMSLQPLTSDEIHSLACLVRELPGALKKNESLDALFQKHIQHALQKNQPHRHFIHAHKALLALQDFQKELTTEDLKQIFYAIQPAIHPLLRDALMAGAKEQMTFIQRLGFFATSMQDMVTEIFYESPGRHQDF